MLGIGCERHRNGPRRVVKFRVVIVDHSVHIVGRILHPTIGLFTMRRKDLIVLPALGLLNASSCFVLTFATRDQGVPVRACRALRDDPMIFRRLLRNARRYYCRPTLKVLNSPGTSCIFSWLSHRIIGINRELMRVVWSMLVSLSGVVRVRCVMRMTRYGVPVVVGRITVWGITIGHHRRHTVVGRIIPLRHTPRHSRVHAWRRPVRHTSRVMSRLVGRVLELVLIGGRDLHPSVLVASHLVGLTGLVALRNLFPGRVSHERCLSGCLASVLFRLMDRPFSLSGCLQQYLLRSLHRDANVVGCLHNVKLLLPHDAQEHHLLVLSDAPIRRFAALRNA